MHQYELYRIACVHLELQLHKKAPHFYPESKECGYKKAEVGLSDKPAGVFARGRDTKKQGEHGFQYSIEFRNEIRQGIQYLDPIERVRE